MIRCFYRSADLDGHCSGAIVKYRFPEAVMYPINYGDEFPWGEIEPEDEVYMVDFCLQPWADMMKLSAKLFDRLVWIDHHKSAIEERNKYPLMGGYGRLDTTKAACELTWEYLFPDKPVPLAVKLLSLYDSWTYQGHVLEDMVLPFQMRMRMEELDPKDWKTCSAYWDLIFKMNNPLQEFANVYFSKWIEEGRLLLRYDEANKAKYTRTYAFETVLNPNGRGNTPRRDYKAIAVNLGHTNSKVFDAVWRKECDKCAGKGSVPRMEYDGEASSTDVKRVWEVCIDCSGTGYLEPYDLMTTFVRRKDRLWNVSLYSTKGDVDCSTIARAFGGNGHKGAAGFQCKELPFDY